MHRPNVPRYRLHKASGQAVVTLNGVDHYLGRHASSASREKYDRLIAEWLAGDRQIAGYREPHGLTIVQLLAAFWRHAELYYRRSDGTPTNELATYRQALRPLRALYGRISAAEFGPRGLRAVRQRMIELGWCRTVINKQVSRLRSVFKWGSSHELVPVSVLQSLQTVSGLKKGRSSARESEPVGPAPETDIAAIRDNVSRQVWALVQLQMLTGARAGELVELRPVDLDTADKIWAYEPKQHKTAHHGAVRRILFGPKAQEVIGPFLVKRPLNDFLFSPAEAEEERHQAQRTARKTPVQPSQRHRAGLAQRRVRKRTPRTHYTVSSYRRAIQRACHTAGVQAWHPHQLRHLAATRLRKEYGIDVAQTILGHRLGSSITEIYAEANGERAKEVMAQIG